jgi:hypothetical protein
VHKLKVGRGVAKLATSVVSTLTASIYKLVAGATFTLLTGSQQIAFFKNADSVLYSSLRNTDIGFEVLHSYILIVNIFIKILLLAIISYNFVVQSSSVPRRHWSQRDVVYLG